MAHGWRDASCVSRVQKGELRQNRRECCLHLGSLSRLHRGENIRWLIRFARGRKALVDIGPLYLQHKDTLHRVAASVLREVGLQDEKEDVVLEAILSVMKSPPTDEIRNWEAFLVRVVKNKAYDRIRAADVGHFGRALDMEQDDHANPGEDAVADTDEKLDQARVGAHVWDSMAVLNERERQVVREIIQKQRSQGEVADELGVSRPRVNQILKAALLKLREELVRKGVTR